MAEVNNGQDKFTAVWVSHTTIRDFLTCPRVYFLKNVYRDPRTGHKIKLITPPLALGQAVHEVIESLSKIPLEKRMDQPLLERFENSWRKVAGKKGGFANKDAEEKHKQRGKAMLKKISQNPGPIAKLAVKIKMDLPYFWLSEKDNLILCGKIDWLEYLPEADGVHIIDFKTGRFDEDLESLQLPIYLLLTSNCQKHPVEKVSYWYLDRSDSPQEQVFPDLEEAKVKVVKIAKEIKLARQLARFKCPHKDGCRACRPFEAILRSEAEFVGVDEFNSDLYVLDKSFSEGLEESVVL